MDDIGWLLDHQHGGQYEPLLDQLGLKHHRLESGNYKIIDRIIDDLIFMLDIFDGRQDHRLRTVLRRARPEKMAW